MEARIRVHLYFLLRGIEAMFCYTEVVDPKVVLCRSEILYV